MSEYIKEIDGVKLEVGMTIIANGNAQDITDGEEYVICQQDCNGDFEFLDDDGDARNLIASWSYMDGNVTWTLKLSPKAMLKSGMRVVYRACMGNRILVDTILIGDDGGWLLLGDYNEDLTYDDVDSKLDIMKIYNKPYFSHQILIHDEVGSLVWERKEEEPTQELTVTEIEAKLGYKVKVVK